MAGLWRRVLRGSPRVNSIASRLKSSRTVEMLAARKVEAGISDAEARRQVQLEVGSIETAREQIAEGRTGFALEQIVRETG